MIDRRQASGVTAPGQRYMPRTHTVIARVALVAALTLAPALISSSSSSLSAGQQTAASGSDPQFKVRLDFNRWHDVAELKSDFEKLAKAWPKYLTLSSLGKSHAGRDIILNHQQSGHRRPDV